jgi:hypothetical protein
MIFLDENKTFYITPRSNTFNTLRFTNESTSEVLEVVDYTSSILDYGIEIEITDTLDVDTFYMLDVINGVTERITEAGDYRLTESGDTRVDENTEAEETIVYKGKVFSTNRSKENYSVNDNNYITI